MERYSLQEVMSGDEESCMWVSLGFTSELEANDVLHIVCGNPVEAEDRDGAFDGLYLERFDQAYGCYGGAELVRVTPLFIEVRLNKKGSEALDFIDGGVTLDVPTGLVGYGDAL